MGYNLMIKAIIPVLLLITVLTITGCSEDKGKKLILENLTPVESTLTPYHQLIFQEDSRSEALQRFPVLSSIMFQHIAGLPYDNPSAAADSFYSNPAAVNIALLIDSVYNDFSMIQKQYNQSVTAYHHFFPQRPIPQLYTLQTNLGVANFMFEDSKGNDAIGTSLDFFLGKRFPYLALSKENPAFSNYNNRTFNRDHLITKTMGAVVDDLVGEAPVSDFLNLMIREGKKLYVLEKISPHLPDTAIFEFSPEQLSWCQNNEYEIWNFFLEKDMMYEKSVIQIAKYIQPAPTSHGMPPMAPGRTGCFIGYKIIESFMDQNPGTDLSYLLALSDAQEILNRAQYKPKVKR